MMRPSVGPPLLYITCYLDDFVPTVGEQYVLISFQYSDDCVSNGIASTPMASKSSTYTTTVLGMQTNHAVAPSSTGLSDSVALALVLTFTGLAALTITCIGLNYIVARTKRQVGLSA